MAGPSGTDVLKLLGARVIKVEPLRGDELRRMGPPLVHGESPFYYGVNRGKESVALDLERIESRPVLHRLVSICDVLVHNFRPQAIPRMGLAYTELTRLQPRLIYCGVTAYASDGSKGGCPGFDTLFQAETGLMSITGPVDGAPYRSGFPLADTSGGIWLAMAVTTALLRREQTGAGALVEIPLHDCLLSLLAPMVAYVSATGRNPDRMGNGSLMGVAGTFVTADGKTISFSVPSDKFWRQLCGVLGRPDLVTNSRYISETDRLSHNHEIVALLTEIIGSKTAAEWYGRFENADLPFSSVKEFTQIINEHEAELEKINDPIGSHTLMLPRFPLRMTGVEPAVHNFPERCGQSTRRVLGELGFSKPEIEELHNLRVVGWPQRDESV